MEYHKSKNNEDNENDSEEYDSEEYEEYEEYDKYDNIMPYYDQYSIRRSYGFANKIKMNKPYNYIKLYKTTYNNDMDMMVLFKTKQKNIYSIGHPHFTEINNLSNNDCYSIVKKNTKYIIIKVDENYIKDINNNEYNFIIPNKIINFITPLEIMTNELSTILPTNIFTPNILEKFKKFVININTN